MILKICTETAKSNGAIWDEFSEQHLHQNIIKAPYSIPSLHFLK